MKGRKGRRGRGGNIFQMKMPLLLLLLFRCTLLEFNKRDFLSIFTHDRVSLAELEIR
jgi:hypothetical protein